MDTAKSSDATGIRVPLRAWAAAVGRWLAAGAVAVAAAATGWAATDGAGGSAAGRGGPLPSFALPTALALVMGAVVLALVCKRYRSE